MTDHGSGFTTMPMAEARAAIEVHAGLIPGQPVDEFTRHWFITSDQWQTARQQAEASTTYSDTALDQGVAATAELLLQVQGQANAYAAYLMLQPDRVNWVKTEWIWF